MGNSLNLTLSEFVYKKYLPDKMQKDSTEKNKQRKNKVEEAILPYLGHIQTNKICVDDIIQWQNQLLSMDKTVTYIKDSQKMLKTIFTYAKRKHGLLYDPSTEAFDVFSASITKDKTAKRQQNIIELLLENDISKEQLQNRLQINPHTLKNDIKILREKYGCIIESHKGVIYLKNREFFKIQQKPVTYEDVQQLLLLYVLNDKPTKYTEIGNSPLFRLDSYITEYSLRKLLNTLRDQSLVIYHEDGYTYSNNSGLCFFSLPENANEIFRFILHCLLFEDVPTQLYNHAIHYLANINNNSYSPLVEQTEMVYKKHVNHARTHSTLYNLSFYIDKLCQLDYQNDALSFKYSTSNNKETNISFFYVGLIIYSYDKDILYILGRERPTKQAYIICRADRIHWNTLHSANNTQFREKLNNDNEFRKNLKKEFEEIKLEMFDISADKKEIVKIKIEYSVEAESEFKKLAASRKHSAQVNYETNLGNLYPLGTDIPQNETILYIVYSDIIRGLGGFANYIRKFGDKIIVLENEILRKQLLNSASRVLENYNERIISNDER